MFIDRSYFTGEIVIPSLNKPEVGSRLDLFIEQCETELLKDLFGYQFYNAMMNGLREAEPAQIWKDLLEGADFVGYNGRTQHWVGLVGQPLDLINAISAANVYTMTVGGPGQYDPVPNANTVLLPPAYVGKDIEIDQRGFGRLEPNGIDWKYAMTNIPNDTIELIGGKIFSLGDKYFLRSTTLAIETTAGTTKKSLIAYYVYYQWQRDSVTQSVGLGEAAVKAENAQMVSPGLKMVNAWNKMSEHIQWMIYYLRINRAKYPDWWLPQEAYVAGKYRPINQFSI